MHKNEYGINCHSFPLPDHYHNEEKHDSHNNKKHKDSDPNEKRKDRFRWYGFYFLDTKEKEKYENYRYWDLLADEKICHVLFMNQE